MGQSLKKVFCQRGIVVAILQRSLAANIQVFGYAKGDLDIPPQPQPLLTGIREKDRQLACSYLTIHVSLIRRIFHNRVSWRILEQSVCTA